MSYVVWKLRRLFWWTDKLGYEKCIHQVTIEEIGLLDTMLASLVELLEEKGVLTREEYEKRIMEKVKIRWSAKEMVDPSSSMLSLP